MTELTRDQAASATEVTIEIVRLPGGTEGSVVDQNQKLSDKRSALVEFGKHLGMFAKAGDDAEHLLHIVETTDAKRLAVVALLIAHVGLAETGDRRAARAP